MVLVEISTKVAKIAAKSAKRTELVSEWAVSAVSSTRTFLMRLAQRELPTNPMLSLFHCFGTIVGG